MLTHTTISGISTALVNSGISIIRLSGPDSLNIISKMFSNYNRLKPNSIIYGKILSNSGEILDNVLVSYFKAPNSFTGEDVCEINCHGGKQITVEILEETIKNGASLAGPGEFSKRAFLNGKMDLSQAEAVIDLINSKSKIQSKIAVNQLQGAMHSKITELRDKLIELMAHIEVSIDYPEYDYEEVNVLEVQSLLKYELNEIKNILKSYEEGRYLKEGVNVAILGVPNVGKSSLLNNLAKYDKAIVTDIEGTTRDIIEETINIGNIILNISDTAGIRKTEDVVEKIGVEKTLKKLDEIDLVIYMINADKKVNETDIDILSKIQNKGIKIVCVINKMDRIEKSIFGANMNELENLKIKDIVKISIIDNKGIDELKNKIVETFNKNDFEINKDTFIVNSRHKESLIKAEQLLIKTVNDFDKNSSIDIISISIKQLAEYLGDIIGANVSEDVVNKIFEKFCLGK
ncbi:MAG: tRNA uridine-5-carboxymethylaminomethyl(34) synthesis GTPase MnmE [Clostridia bacterium]|nr:tRNA uridine-5-carboxymethylaminomethyl(34) synthesis GTPase MnmE [Clostridia bacterium]